MWRRLAPAAAAVTLALLAAGCGGGSKPFTIGVVVDCEGVFSGYKEQVLAGAELPLLERGGKSIGKRPSDGIAGPTVAGRSVELRQGCAEITYLTQLIENVRRLVEADHADVVVAPMVGNAEGIVLRALARRYPAVAFEIGYSGAQETTLRDPAPNVFRFSLDAAQGEAGLGTYAYRDLGWRHVTVVFTDNEITWPQAAGFVAEFCALGGSVQRVAAEGPAAAAVSRLANGTDGVALMALSFPDTVGFASTYARTQSDLAKHLVLGLTALTFGDPHSVAKSAPLLRGVVQAGFSHDASDPAWTTFRRSYLKHFPGLGVPTTPADFPIVLTYYDAVEASLRALEQAREAGPAFLRALASTTLNAPGGRIRLDRNRQAIVSTYLSRFDVGAKGAPQMRTFRVFRNVEQTFAGYFSSTTATPTATRPGCHSATPPPWSKYVTRRG
jgi:branched-chain amino acid transport system substrate-binding protein